MCPPMPLTATNPSPILTLMSNGRLLPGPPDSAGEPGRRPDVLVLAPRPEPVPAPLDERVDRHAMPGEEHATARLSDDVDGAPVRVGASELDPVDAAGGRVASRAPSS